MIDELKLALSSAETALPEANAVAAREAFGSTNHGAVMVPHTPSPEMVTRRLAHSCLSLLHHTLCN